MIDPAKIDKLVRIKYWEKKEINVNSFKWNPSKTQYAFLVWTANITPTVNDY